MGTLNPTIPSPELTKTLNAAAARMKAFGQPYLTPALLLATFARDADSAAHRLLTTPSGAKRQPGLSRAWKRKRGRSGRWKASAAGRC